MPSPKAAFDNDMFMVHMVGRFLQSGGKALEDDACMESSRLGWIPAPLPNRIKY